MKKVRLYIAEHCAPCKELREIVEKTFAPEQIEVIDIETDEGFDQFTDEVIAHSDGEVPSAYKDGIQCRIFIEEDETVSFECPVKGHSQVERIAPEGTEETEPTEITGPPASSEQD